MEEEIKETPVSPLPQEIISITPKKSPLPVILLVILGLLVVAGAVYAGITIGKKQTQLNVIAEPTIVPQTTDVSSVPDETANWKTYENSYWKITFKYPNTLFKPCLNYVINEKDGVRFWGPQFDCAPGDVLYKIGFVGYDPGKYTEYKKPLSTEKITIDGKQALKKTYIYDESDGPLFSLKQSVEIVVTLSNGTIVLQQLRDNPVEQKAFDQILSTFKFSVDQNLVDERANWKTYTNNTSSYSLKYPPTWKIFESDQLLGNGEISDTKWNLSTTNDVPNIRIMVYKSDSNFVKSIPPGINQMVIFGKTATKTVTEGHTFIVEYRMTNETNTYFIDLEIISNKDSNQYEPLFDQILSTFKFLP